GRGVAQWARAQPDQAAYVVGADRLSWFDYDARATRLATILAGAGLPRGARVAVLLPDVAAVHIAFVAAERAGLVVVGIGHRAGDAEVRHLLGVTNAAAIVTLAGDEQRVPADSPLARFTVDR